MESGQIKVVYLKPINHNGNNYSPGDTGKVTQADFKWLFGSDSVAPIREDSYPPFHKLKNHKLKNFEKR